MSTPRSATSARDEVRGVAPKLIELSEKVLYADVWERPGLSKRDRSLITVAALIATYRPEQLETHLTRAISNGVTKDEIQAILHQIAIYAGVPLAVECFRAARKVFAEVEKGA